MSSTGISLVVPFYNEESVLDGTIRELLENFRKKSSPFELILADDGSTDASPAQAREWVKKQPDLVRIVANKDNLGRGSVLTKGFSAARYPLLVYIDADLEIGVNYLNELIGKFDDPNVKICTGSKTGTEQKLYRARHRKLASHVYNRLVFKVLRSPVSDHQCGLKGFRREVLIPLLSACREIGWAWDTEILLLAQKKGIRIDEFPVELSARRKSTVPFLKTVLTFLLTTVKFRLRGLQL